MKLVIRLSDGLVMDFKMLMKNPSKVISYQGTKQPGQTDLNWLNKSTPLNLSNLIS